MDTTDAVDFAARLRQAREASGMTQRQAADALALTQSTYAGWEMGRTEPRFSMVVRMCDLFGITPNQLFLGDEPPAERRRKLTRKEEDAILAEAGRIAVERFGSP